MIAKNRSRACSSINWHSVGAGSDKQKWSPEPSDEPFRAAPTSFEDGPTLISAGQETVHISVGFMYHALAEARV